MLQEKKGKQIRLGKIEGFERSLEQNRCQSNLTKFRRVGYKYNRHSPLNHQLIQDGI